MYTNKIENETENKNTASIEHSDSDSDTKTNDIVALSDSLPLSPKTSTVFLFVVSCTLTIENQKSNHSALRSLQALCRNRWISSSILGKWGKKCQKETNRLPSNQYHRKK